LDFSSGASESNGGPKVSFRLAHMKDESQKKKVPEEIGKLAGNWGQRAISGKRLS
jgi:hypothetical protein